MQDIRIVFDTTEVEKQADELANLFRKVFPEGIPNDVVNCIANLPLDISIGDGSTTLGADGIMEHRLLVRFGSRFHNIMAALRAGKIADLSHLGISSENLKL